MPMVSYLEQFPTEKLSLINLHKNPFSLLFLGFLEFFFSHMIINWIQPIRSYFSTSSSSFTPYKSGSSDSFVNKDDRNNQYSKELMEKWSDNNIDDGSLSREEIEMVMGNLGLFYEHENENVEERYNLNDVFEKKEVSFDEVKEGFDVFDENKDGFIDALELQKVVRALGLKEEAGIENCKRMISVFDQNRDEKIDFQEFVKLLNNSLN